MKPPLPTPLHDVPIQFAKGVGPQRARLLQKLGVHTLEDAAWFIPWRYEDRTLVQPIGTLLPGGKATILGVVKTCQAKTTYRRRLSVVTITVQDETGLVECVFFNQPFLEKTMAPGTRLLLTGVISEKTSGSHSLSMRGPQYEILDEAEPSGEDGRIIPIYHETQGLSSKQFRRVIKTLFEMYEDQFPEIFTPEQRKAFGFPNLVDALGPLHFPRGKHAVESLNEGQTVEHQRLAFEELFLLQLALAMRRTHFGHTAKGIPFDVHNPLMARLTAALPFPLTRAQKRVIQEIFDNMADTSCMNRLLQGDVGCGKTVVALHAMVAGVGSGYQVALMAPTEVLSEQHFTSLQPFFEALGLTALLLKGGQTGVMRASALKQIHSGDAQIIVGTHALLQPDVQFAKLGFVIVDEQHKFGVVQRAKLRGKAPWDPDVLVMTATPIPRTLAMTLYGDLDVSVIDEFPPGKKDVKTQLFRKTERAAAYKILRDELDSGRQGYVVFPLVEASEKVDLQAAEEAVQQLGDLLQPYRVGLLHGRLGSKDKQAVMGQFQRKEIDVLVATTVVEVGLDIHNATIMIIEHAERFGLAQLHQLRGRVGRGRHQGFCLLIHGLGRIPPFSQQQTLPLTQRRHSPDRLVQEPAEPLFHEGAPARHRLSVFAHFHDGFALAEEDLKMRGPGHILGVKQWGEIEFKVADLSRDFDLLTRAKSLASEIMGLDPELHRPEHRALKEVLFRKWGKAIPLGVIG